MLSKVLSLISLTQIDAILVDKQCVSPVRVSSQQLSLEEQVNFLTIAFNEAFRILFTSNGARHSYNTMSFSLLSDHFLTQLGTIYHCF